MQVAYHISGNIPRTVFGDAQRLQQILLNMLNNAVKFTEKGEICLEVWMDGHVDLDGQNLGHLAISDHASASGQAPAAAAAHDSSAAAGAAAASGRQHAPPAGHSLDDRHLASLDGGPSLDTSGNGCGPSPSGDGSCLQTVTLQFRVRDTGIGISAGDLGLLFHSFSQVIY